MSTAPALMSTLDDDAWDDLLSFIEERRVIPIVGPELLLVATDRGPRLLLDWVAERLAARLNVKISELPQPYTLNDVVCWFLAARGRREEAYVRMRSIIKESNFEPPVALRRLAVIQELIAVKAQGGLQENEKSLCLWVSQNLAGHIGYVTGDFQGAERALRAAINARQQSGVDTVQDRRDMGELSTWLAMAVARQGRLAEAAQIIAPVVQLQRQLGASNHGDRWLTVELAAALYAEAQSDPKGKAALLREAAARLEAAPAAIKALHDNRRWHDMIDAAARSAAGSPTDHVKAARDAAARAAASRSAA